MPHCLPPRLPACQLLLPCVYAFSPCPNTPTTVILHWHRHTASLSLPLMPRQSHIGYSFIYHSLDIIDGNRVGAPAVAVVVARPPGEVVEVLAVYRVLNLKLHQSGAIRSEYDVEQPSPVRANLKDRQS